MFELKPISRDAIPEALEKADRYRLLNEPMGAESICRDVLRVDPGNQRALIALILSLTDQIGQRANEVVRECRELIPQLASEYHQYYYSGIVFERRAKCRLQVGGPGSGYVAYDFYRQAMEHYEKAHAMRPAGEDSSTLRWNTCARILDRHPELVPEPEDQTVQMLE